MYSPAALGLAAFAVALAFGPFVGFYGKVPALTIRHVLIYTLFRASVFLAAVELIVTAAHELGWDAMLLTPPVRLAVFAYGMTFVRAPELNGTWYHLINVQRWPLFKWVQRALDYKVVLDHGLQNKTYKLSSAAAARGERAKPVIFALAPHGWMPWGAGFMCNGDVVGAPSEEESAAILKDEPHAALPSSWSQMLRGHTVRMSILNLIFYVPGVRELFAIGGVVEVSQHTIRRMLLQGHSPAVFVGGAREAHYACQEASTAKHPFRIVAYRRRELFRLALELGVDIVPVVTFGDSNLMRFWSPGGKHFGNGAKAQPMGGVGRAFKDLTGFATLLPTSPVLCPPKGVTTVIGEPLDLAACVKSMDAAEAACECVGQKHKHAKLPDFVDIPSEGRNAPRDSRTTPAHSIWEKLSPGDPCAPDFYSGKVQVRMTKDGKARVLPREECVDHAIDLYVRTMREIYNKHAPRFANPGEDGGLEVVE